MCFNGKRQYKIESIELNLVRCRYISAVCKFKCLVENLSNWWLNSSIWIVNASAMKWCACTNKSKWNVCNEKEEREVHHNEKKRVYREQSKYR